MSRRSAARFFVAVALLGGGCSRAGAELGAGARDLDVCAAWVLFDSFDEPPPNDRTELLRWTRGGIRVIDRIDFRREVDDEPVPSSIKRRLGRMESSLRELRDELEAADNSVEVDQAVADFSVGSFNTSARAVSDFEAAKCSS